VFGEGLRGGSEGGSGASRLEPVPELVPKVVPSWFPPTGTGSGACVVPRIPPPSQGGTGNHHATGDFSGEILFPVSGRNGGIPIPVNGRSRAHRVDAPGRDLAICESRNDSACRGPFQPVDRPVPARLVAPAYLFGARLDFQSTRTTPRSAQNRTRRPQLATRRATPATGARHLGTGARPRLRVPRPRPLAAFRRNRRLARPGNRPASWRNPSDSSPDPSVDTTHRALRQAERRRAHWPCALPTWVRRHCCPVARPDALSTGQRSPRWAKPHHRAPRPLPGHRLL
jgi:hypothetical protein